ncbi:MAG: NAD(P)-dependent oxidoreductase [Patescibacteria group bacterium]|nr:hypothetical protein [Patescibacteria group bacterium]
MFITKRINIPEKQLKRLRKYAEVEFVEDDSLDIRKIKPLLKDGDKILAPFPEPMNWILPGAFLAEIPDLKGVCLSTTSFEWVDGKALRKKGISLTNVPASSTNAVAEGAICMMFAVARRFPVIMKQKEFSYIPENLLAEIKGKTAGIIGLGNIGSRIAQLTDSLGMKVVYWSKKSRNMNYKYLALKKLLKVSDFVFVCLEMNDKTSNFVSKEEMDLLKKTSSLIDISHRGIVDWKSLVRSVKQGKLYGAASDNQENISISPEDNIFIMPHVNWFTRETLEEKVEVWVDSIISVIKQKPRNLVN